MLKNIVTHSSPDLDAICSVWLLKRFGTLTNNPVAFVNTAVPDKNLLESAVAVVDTGGEWDAQKLRFDHHQLPGVQSKQYCAATQVAAFLEDLIPGCVSHLTPLLDLVLAVDTGQRNLETKNNLLVGIPAIFRGYQKRNDVKDEDMLAFGMEILDALATSLRMKQVSERLLKQKTRWMSQDGKVRYIDNAPQETSNAAFELGTEVVLFSSISVLPNGQETHSIGIWRNPECSSPNCGEIIDTIEAEETDAVLKEELSSWYRHPAGFYSGRGTAKAPRQEPINIDVKKLAQKISAAW